MRGGYQIATFLLRKLRAHHDVMNTSPRINMADADPTSWEMIPPIYSFLAVCNGQGFEISVRPVELAS